MLVVESLKKRPGSRIFGKRAVPHVPGRYNRDGARHPRTARQGSGKGRGMRLWPWSRMTRWLAMHAVMQAAALATGAPASGKGLRHGFGGHSRHPAQPGAEMAGPCPAQHNRCLRQYHGRRRNRLRGGGGGKLWCTRQRTRTRPTIFGLIAAMSAMARNPSSFRRLGREEATTVQLDRHEPPPITQLPAFGKIQHAI